MMAIRSNAMWLDELASDSPLVQSPALSDLRVRLQRGIFYYLSRERSDLTDRSHGELQQMAEDFSQEALLRVLDNLHTFRGDSQFTTWATKIAVRVAISELRRARYKDFSLENLTIDGEIMPDLRRTFGAGDIEAPERSTERNDVLQKISDALTGALTDRQRAAFDAVILQGVPMDVVANQLDTNRNALYKLLHDARRKLKAALEQQGLNLDYIMKLFQE